MILDKLSVNPVSRSGCL